MVAGKDPLRDESYHMLRRLVYVRMRRRRNLGKDVFLKEYRELPHGFWCYDLPMGIPEYGYTVSDSAAWLKELAAKHEERLRLDSDRISRALGGMLGLIEI